MKENYYQAYGMTFVSDIPIDFLSPCEAQPSDFVVRLGDVDARLKGYEFSTQFANWKASKGCFFIDVTETAQYLILNGNEILIQPKPMASQDSVVAFLFSSGMAALLQQREVLTLHASAVMAKEGAVLFIGPSGVGKSTTMAALNGLGYQMITDDIAAVSITNDGTAEITPGYPNARLRGDALKKIGKDQDRYVRLRKQVDKFVVPLDNFNNSAGRINRIYLLEVHECAHVVTELLPHSQAFKWLSYYTFRKRFYDGMALNGFHFEILCQLMSVVEIYRLKRPDDPNMLDKLIDKIMSEVGQPVSVHNSIGVD